MMEIFTTDEDTKDNIAADQWHFTKNENKTRALKNKLVKDSL